MTLAYSQTKKTELSLSILSMSLVFGVQFLFHFQKSDCVGDYFCSEAWILLLISSIAMSPRVGFLIYRYHNSGKSWLDGLALVIDSIFALSFVFLLCGFSTGLPLYKIGALICFSLVILLITVKSFMKGF